MLTVECVRHGPQQETFVCQHIVHTLADGQPRGFFWSTAARDNPRPNAWCTECNRTLELAGDWTAEAEQKAGVTLLCGACYDEAKQLNGL
jgi:hypothetical protein